VTKMYLVLSTIKSLKNLHFKKKKKKKKIELHKSDWMIADINFHLHFQPVWGL